MISESQILFRKPGKHGSKVISAIPAWVCRSPETIALRSVNWPIYLPGLLFQVLITPINLRLTLQTLWRGRGEPSFFSCLSWLWQGAVGRLGRHTYMNTKASGGWVLPSLRQTPACWEMVVWIPYGCVSMITACFNSFCLPFSPFIGLFLAVLVPFLSFHTSNLSPKSSP